MDLVERRLQCNNFGCIHSSQFEIELMADDGWRLLYVYVDNYMQTYNSINIYESGNLQRNEDQHNRSAMWKLTRSMMVWHPNSDVTEYLSINIENISDYDRNSWIGVNSPLPLTQCAFPKLSVINFSCLLCKSEINSFVIVYNPMIY